MNLNLERLTIRELLANSFEQYKLLPSISFVGEDPQDYETLRKRVFSLCRELLAAGVKPGDRVAILGDNSPQWVEAYLAILFIGAVAVPILPGFTDSDCRHILRNSQAVALFIANNQVNKIEELNSSWLHTIISLEDFSKTSLQKDHLKSLEAWIHTLLQKTEHSAEEIMQELPGPAEDDLAVLIYTSGTTGHSKGVMLTHKNITSNVLNSIQKFPITKDDYFLSILPLAHTFEATGGMLCPLAVGASIAYMRGLPTPQKLLSAMETVRPTAVLTVPLVVDKIYRKRILPKLHGNPLTALLMKWPVFRKVLHKLAGKKLLQTLGGRLRFFMFGGASLNRDVEIFLRDAGISYSTGYGMTETSPILTINPFGKVKVGSCGQAVPGVEIKINNPAPESGIGEILVKGPNVMMGYYNNEVATKEVLTEDGWLKTGDLGCLDEENYLYIKGRSKNVIVGPSGENVYPEIVEQALTQNVFIQEAVVYESNGQLVAKVHMDYDALDSELDGDVTYNERAEQEKRDILERIRKEVNVRLPAFSRVSKLIEHPDAFEKTPTNKVKRYLYIPAE